ncbi:MAG: hypothetical protein JWO77_2688 [Ilumatobacteraceae bacterium]|nr:hypothetical protein [Ilumatobacteraceae bacterium]
MTTPAAPSPAPTPSPEFTPTHKSGELDRRTIWISAAVLFGVLVIGIGAMALFADPGNEPAPSDGKPHIIERPNSGTEPTNPGDRGGWEQLAVLGGIIVVLGGIAFVAFKGGSQAKANRERWKAAGESGHDGALDP